MLIKYVILAALLMPSIMAALSDEEMADALIKAEKEGELVKTFKKFEKGQNHFELSHALANVAKIPEHMPKVATCLRTVDPFPTEMSRVSDLVHYTLELISDNTEDDTESFTKVIASFEPSDVKPLASIRYRTLHRSDAVKVLENVMAKSPQLITGSLSRWLANHSFDQDSSFYAFDKVAREQVFQYLTFFATEDALNDALAIVTKNEHYKVESDMMCCNFQDSFPRDLVTKLSALLAFVKDRNARIKMILTFLPKVLVSMVADYLRASTD